MSESGHQYTPEQNQLIEDMVGDHGEVLSEPGHLGDLFARTVVVYGEAPELSEAANELVERVLRGTGEDSTEAHGELITVFNEVEYRAKQVEPFVPEGKPRPPIDR